MCNYRYHYYSRCRHLETVLQAFCKDAVPVTTEADATQDDAPAPTNHEEGTHGTLDNGHAPASEGFPWTSSFSHPPKGSSTPSTFTSSAFQEQSSLQEYRPQQTHAEAMAGLASITHALGWRTGGSRQMSSSTPLPQATIGQQHTRTADERSMSTLSDEADAEDYGIVSR